MHGLGEIAMGHCLKKKKEMVGGQEGGGPQIVYEHVIVSKCEELQRICFKVTVHRFQILKKYVL